MHANCKEFKGQLTHLDAMQANVNSIQKDLGLICDRLSRLDRTLQKVQERKNAFRVFSWEYQKDMELKQHRLAHEREVRQTEARFSREQRRREYRHAIANAKKREEEFYERLRKEEVKAKKPAPHPSAPSGAFLPKSEHSETLVPSEDSVQPVFAEGHATELDSFYEDGSPARDEGGAEDDTEELP